MKKLTVIAVIIICASLYATYTSVMSKVHSESNPNNYKRKVDEPLNTKPQTIIGNTLKSTSTKSAIQNKKEKSATEQIIQQEAALKNTNSGASAKQLVNEFDIGLVPDAPAPIRH